MLPESCSASPLHLCNEVGDRFPEGQGGPKHGDCAAVREAGDGCSSDGERPPVCVFAVDDGCFLGIYYEAV